MSSTQVSPHDQLRSLVRQRWTLLSVWVAVTALVAVWALRSGDWSSEASLQVVDESTLAAGGGLDAGVMPIRRAGAEAEFLKGDPVVNELATRQGLSLTATPIDQADTVSVRATSDGRDVDVQLGAVIESYLARRRQSTVDQLRGAIAVKQERIEQINARVEEISRILSAGATRFDSRDSLQLERVRALDDLAENQGKLLALEQLERSTTGGVIAIASPSAPSRGTAGSDKLIAAAALVGLLAAIGVGLLRTRLDRRLRSVSDIEDIAPNVPILGLLPTTDQPDEQRLAVVARAIRHRAKVAGARQVLVCSVSSRAPAASDLVALLERRSADTTGGAVIKARTCEGVPMSTMLADERLDGVVLTVSAGTARREDLASAVHQVNAVGVSLLGIVLTDVALREQTLAYASHSRGDS